MVAPTSVVAALDDGVTLAAMLTVAAGTVAVRPTTDGLTCVLAEDTAITAVA